jgi:hypothetical protein
VQTVENFFDFAFLLKVFSPLLFSFSIPLIFSLFQEKRAMETLNPSNGLPYLVQVDPGTMKEHWGNETKQMVIPIPLPPTPLTTFLSS